MSDELLLFNFLKIKLLNPVVRAKMRNMKLPLTILLLFFCHYFSGLSQSFSVGEPTPVASGLGSNHPQIELASDGLPLVLWTSPSPKNIYIAKGDGNGGFLSPIQLNPENFPVQSYNWSGPDLAVENDNVYVVFRSNGYDTGHIFVTKSNDNGGSFGDTVRVDQLTAGFGQYPDIAVYNDTIWVTFMSHNSSGLDPQYVVARSVDGGLTYENEVLAGALLGDEACDCCQPEIVVNESQVVVFFRNNDNNIRDIKAVVSYDRGQSFTNWISLDDHQWLINSCPSTGPDARFINENTIAATYKTEVNGEARVYVNAYDLSTDQSLGEVLMTMDGSSNLNVNYPQIATKNNVLGVVWEGQGEQTDIFINTSTSGIGGLSPANAFNLTNTSGNQTRPDIAMSSNTFHVVYSSNLNVHYVKAHYLVEKESFAEPVSFKAYPNPTHNQLNIELVMDNNTPYELSVLTINGEVKQWFNDATFFDNKTLTISTENWAKGVYILRLNSQYGSYLSKIVVL